MKRLHIIAALAALCAACLLASRTVGVLCDDAFITFIYAKNWAILHRGLTYNGAIVQGYTNPLWTLILAGLARLGADLPTAAIWLGRLSACAFILATYWLGRVAIHPQITQTTQIPVRDQSVKSVDIWLPLLPAAFVAFSFDVAIYTASGLETVLFAALFTAAVAALLLVGRGNPAPPSGWHGYASPTVILPAVLCGLLALTRPEGLAVILAATLFLAWSARVGAHGHAPAGAGGRPSAPTMISAALFLGIAALITLPWFVWAHAYYGDWLPNSFYAKAGAFSVWQLRHGLQYIFRPGLWGVMVPLLILLLLLGLRRGNPARAPAFAALAWILYVVLIGADYMPGLRVLVPALGLAAVAVVASAARTRRPAVVLALGFIAIVVGRWLDQDTQRGVIAWRYRLAQRTELGLWLHAHVEPTAVIALQDSGVIPYYAELATIDELGMNDRHIAHHGLRDPRILPGHQVGDGSYVLDRRPDLLFAAPFEPPHGLNLVSDRTLRRDPRFWRDYHGVFILLPSGRVEGFLQRNGSEGKLIGVPADTIQYRPLRGPGSLGPPDS